MCFLFCEPDVKAKHFCQVIMPNRALSAIYKGPLFFCDKINGQFLLASQGEFSLNIIFSEDFSVSQNGTSAKSQISSMALSFPG